MNAGRPIYFLYVGPDGSPFEIVDRNAVAELLSFHLLAFAIGGAGGFLDGRPATTLIFLFAPGDTHDVEELERGICCKLGRLRVGIKLKRLYQKIAMV